MLPDPFLFQDGTRVTSREDWSRRRVELLDLFQSHEYGHMPPAPPKTEGVELISHMISTLSCLHKQFRVTCGQHTTGPDQRLSFLVDLAIPNGKGPFPIILRGDWGWFKTPDSVAIDILNRGYILAEFNRLEFAPDNANRSIGMYPLYPDHSDLGSVAAWAWSYHRAIDFLLTLPRDLIDPDRIAITGHSRGGKASLLAGALDPRISLTCANASGCGGAGCFRYQPPNSERLADILKNFPFWFSPNLREFADREDTLPFDQHCLKACIAPRALITCESLDDLWGNPIGTYQTHLAAREVYSFLDAPDKLAVHYRHGKHGCPPADWSAFLDFADHLFFNKPLKPDFSQAPFPNTRIYDWSAPQRTTGN